MKLLWTCLFMLLVKLAAAQFAIISDKDGYSNVRDSAGTGSRIAEKLDNGHLVYCFEKKGNWTYINYNKNGQEHTGYVYSDRLKMVSDLEIIQGRIQRQVYRLRILSGLPATHNKKPVIDNQPATGPHLPALRFRSFTFWATYIGSISRRFSKC